MVQVSKKGHRKIIFEDEEYDRPIYVYNLGEHVFDKQKLVKICLTDSMYSNI